MMKRIYVTALIVFVLPLCAVADDFGSGPEAFSIDFVPISGQSNPGEGAGIVDYDYRIGMCEISNDQWNKFANVYGEPDGSPPEAYDNDSFWTNAAFPANYVSWLEAAQFVNWLNADAGCGPAYKFTGTPGLLGYTFEQWMPGDDGYNPDNPMRNLNAKYFLPSENEWLKAAYFNGLEMQTYATAGDVLPGAGSACNYNFVVQGLWNVDSGDVELNGTYNMMGNIGEWTETLNGSGENLIHGGNFGDNELKLRSSYSTAADPWYDDFMGFRVAAVPEPCSLAIFGLGICLVTKPGRNRHYD